MKTAGKFYIQHNVASAKPEFWSQLAQNWTTNAHDATFFESRQEADDEAVYADRYGPGEAIVMQATRDLQPA